MTHLIYVSKLIFAPREYIFNTCILLNLSGSSVSFLLLLHFRKVYLGFIGSKNSRIPLLCNADLFIFYFPGLIIVLT